MAELLKNVYSPTFFDLFSTELKKEIPNFDKEKFLKEIYVSNWENLELKQRMTHIAKVLHEIFKPNYEEALIQICSIIERQKRDHPNGFNFEFMFFPEFIQIYGLNDFEKSIEAIEKVTQYTSCEFVVRHFILKYPEKMVAQMQKWAKHQHYYVRRLASEGMRTRLPWAIKVPVLFEKPQEIFKILDKLILDEAEWVRKSVANSLNDLSKDFPEMTFEFSKKWIDYSVEVNKVLKHANRTGLKQGDLKVLKLFKITEAKHLELISFDIAAEKIKMGSNLEFQISIKNKNSSLDDILRLEYRLYFLRKNGTYHPKTFKINEKSSKNISEIKLSKKHSFKEISTRTFYSGKHHISLIMNGEEVQKTEFTLFS